MIAQKAGTSGRVNQGNLQKKLPNDCFGCSSGVFSVSHQCMSIRIGLTHRTSYAYDRPVSMGPQIIRLRPAPHCRTPIVSYSQTIKPADNFLNWQQDPFGNYLARVVIPEKTREFSVQIDLVADMIAINPFDFFLEESAQFTPFSYDKELKRDLPA